jgi:hypothetical protein
MVVVLVADRRRIEHDPVPGLQEPVAEVDVLAFEETFPGEARVESAQLVEEPA